MATAFPLPYVAHNRSIDRSSPHDTERHDETQGQDDTQIVSVSVGYFFSFYVLLCAGSRTETHAEGAWALASPAHLLLPMMHPA